MSKEKLDATGIPDWYLSTLPVVQRVDGALRGVSVELCDLMENESLDLRVRAELLSMLDDLRAIQGGLVLVQMTASKVLDEVLGLASDQEGRDPTQSRGCRASNMGPGSAVEAARPLSSRCAVQEATRRSGDWSLNNPDKPRAMQVA